MTRVLLTGAAGQLGTDTQRAAENVPGIELLAHDRESLDITDAANTNQVIAAAAPSVIIHGAAWTAVDHCEGDEARSFAVNSTGTKNVLDAAKSVGARVIYVSTDYVFDGTKSDPYVESDTPNPASVYGRSKLAGEAATLADPENLVVRTSWVCSAHGSNMVKTILRLAESHPTLTFVDDQIGKPTFTADLGASLLTLAQRNDTGVMHITNEGVVSWYEFCQDVLRAAGLDPERVMPCSTDELKPPRPAPRPANSVLANTRFAGLGLDLLRDFRAPLAEVVAELI